MIALLARWTEKLAGGPQAGTSDSPPLARVMGVGRQQQQSRVKLLHKGGRMDELKNYQPIAIINITCKLCMLMVRERIDRWTEDSGLLGEIIRKEWLCLE